ncbi:hypothetical protein BJY04DRAFT_80935 [Aspergillus karnatakaensis]|uniref:uncharacterized protein n=1 Tax=Aspergillus karnatakaensis TaxID=1810916 RepID=UPI003CCCCD95
MALRNKAIKGLAAGIGLASESVSAYKANRAERKSQSQSPTTLSMPATDETERLATEQLEQEWELDEAQDELHPPTNISTDININEQGPDNTTNIDVLTEQFMRDIPPPSYTPYETPKLPYPVILPQRRPKDKKRGFIRAYAPVLEGFGIDQGMFLDFLETSNKACQATPWLYALNLASIGTMWMPGAISFIVSAAIQIGTEAAIAVEGRRKTNTFFDKINDEFFRPRGLFCLVMTWDSSSSSTFSRFDLNTAISTAVEHGGPGKLNKMRHKFKSSDGKTHGNLPFPESAPLVFPELDAAAAAGSEAKIKSLKKRDFVADYFDRRGQAQFTLENPENALNMAPKPTFTSRYADPSHPASSGDLFALISGGHISSESLPRRRPGDRDMGRRRGPLASLPGGNIGLRDLPGGGIIHAVRSRRGVPDSLAHDEIENNGHVTGRRGGGLRQPASRRGRDGPLSEGLVGGVQKFFKSNVLYLMIVNMPSEEEMAAAREMFAS